jgi:hypothetical protein
MGRLTPIAPPQNSGRRDEHQYREDLLRAQREIERVASADTWRVALSAIALLSLLLFAWAYA